MNAKEKPGKISNTILIVLVSIITLPCLCGFGVALFRRVLSPPVESNSSVPIEAPREPNHESRLDELENVARGNEVGTAPRENSHDDRIESLEARLDKLEKQAVAPEE